MIYFDALNRLGLTAESGVAAAATNKCLRCAASQVDAFDPRKTWVKIGKSFVTARPNLRIFPQFCYVLSA